MSGRLQRIRVRGRQDWRGGDETRSRPDADRVYRDQRLALVRLAFLLTGSADAAEDIVQTAFVASYARCADLDDPVAYLRRVVVNQAKDHRRRRYRRRPPDPDPAAWLMDPTRCNLGSTTVGTSADGWDEGSDLGWFGAFHPSVTQLRVTTRDGDTTPVTTVPLPADPDGRFAAFTTPPPRRGARWWRCSGPTVPPWRSGWPAARRGGRAADLHGLDLTVPLGVPRRSPDETLRVVLDGLTAGGDHVHFGTDITGTRFGATDLDWSYGDGAVRRGPAADLLLHLCSRRRPSEVV